MHKRVLVLTLSLLVVGQLKAQQDPLLTHFIFNKMAFNPGSTGLDDGFCASTVYRNQWDKVNGAPNSAVLNVEGNMNRFFPGGLGLNFYHDAIGYGRQNNLMVNYSYPVMIGEHTLGLGIGVGFESFGMKPEWITPDQSAAALDPSIPMGFNSTGLDLNLGAYFKAATGFYAGISATHLTSSDLKNKNSLGNPTQTYKVARHYYVMGGYKTKPIGPGIIDAQLLLRTDAHLASVDINARYVMSKLGYAGLTYRTSDAVALMLGFIPIPNFTVGYSYDITLNKLASVSRGSHELFLKYCYYLPIPPVAVSRHPRWL